MLRTFTSQFVLLSQSSYYHHALRTFAPQLRTFATDIRTFAPEPNSYICLSKLVPLPQGASYLCLENFVPLPRRSWQLINTIRRLRHLSTGVTL